MGNIFSGLQTVSESTGWYSKRTHVANGYTQDIWASVVVDINQNASLGTKFEIKLKEATNSFDKKKIIDAFCIQNHFTPIRAGDFNSFYTGDANLNSTVYVSYVNIYLERCIVNYPVQVNRSVIIDIKGYIKEAQYGKCPFGVSKIWTDTRGIDHFPALSYSESNAPENIAQCRVETVGGLMFCRCTRCHLGSGGYGAVFKAKFNDRDVAVKRLPNNKSKVEIEVLDIIKTGRPQHLIKYYGTEADTEFS